MKYSKILLLSVIIVLLLSSCKIKEPAAPPEPSKPNIASNTNANATPADFDTYIAELAMAELKDSPLDATFKFGNLEALGLEHTQSELDSLTYELFKEDIQEAKNIYNTLDRYDSKSLTPEQQLTLETLRYQYGLMVSSEPYYLYTNLIQPSSGIQIYIPLSLMQIEFENENDIKNYLKRVEKLPRLFQQVITYENAKADAGLLLPEDLYDNVITQIDSLLVEPNDFIMMQSFEDQIADVNLSEAQKQAYKDTLLEIVTTGIYPAYENLKTAISVNKLKSPKDNNVAYWENGKDYYDFIVKSKTSYDYSTKKLRKLIESEQAKLLDEIMVLYEENDSLLASSSVGDALPQFSGLDEIYSIEEQCIGDIFYDYDIHPASENIIPPYLEKHLAAGFYFPISLDESAYGNMYLAQNTYDHLDYYTLNLYFHENIPGHHLYFSKLADSDLPLIRKLLSWLPYEEGWAVYMEQYAYDYIDLDPKLVDLYRLNDLYGQYSFLLLDLRYHYYGESRENLTSELIDYGYPKENVDALMNRMIANPGETIHYAFGAYKFNDYLHQCQDALGDKFDIKAFHDLLLENAGLPFYELDKLINNWIED